MKESCKAMADASMAQFSGSITSVFFCKRWVAKITIFCLLRNFARLNWVLSIFMFFFFHLTSFQVLLKKVEIWQRQSQRLNKWSVIRRHCYCSLQQNNDRSWNYCLFFGKKLHPIIFQASIRFLSDSVEMILQLFFVCQFFPIVLILHVRKKRWTNKA